MSAPVRRGLGRGLGALLGDGPMPTTSQRSETLHAIPVAQITPNPFQPRKSFDDESLAELRESIAAYGVLVPIIVRRRGDAYELVAGERRWRACATLQRETIPAIVRNSDDRESLEVAIIENLQREDLNAIEEAAGFANLLESGSLTQEDLARRLGKSRPAVANALRLLALSDGIKAMVVDGRLTAGHARALLAAPAPSRASLAEKTIVEGLSVRAVERLAGTVERPASKAGARESKPLSADEHAFEGKLREKFGTYVALRRSGKGGRIEFRFTSEKDLLRISDLLLDE